MIAPLYAGLLALFYVGLSANVIKTRKQTWQVLGYADNFVLERKVRAHANFAEYAPIFLIIIGYTEYNGLPHIWVHILNCMFLAGRVLHAYSLLKYEKYENRKLISSPKWRILGMVCSIMAITITALILIFQSI